VGGVGGGGGGVLGGVFVWWGGGGFVFLVFGESVGRRSGAVYSTPAVILQVGSKLYGSNASGRSWSSELSTPLIGEEEGLSSKGGERKGG